jgi:EamA domain-containing membrane protein RarD
MLAGTLWGTLGVFYKYLNSSFQLSSIEIVFWRAFFASFFTLVLLSLWRKLRSIFNPQKVGRG